MSCRATPEQDCESANRAIGCQQRLLVTHRIGYRLLLLYCTARACGYLYDARMNPRSYNHRITLMITVSAEHMLAAAERGGL